MIFRLLLRGVAVLSRAGIVLSVFFGGMFILVVVTSIDKAFYDIAVTVDASVAQERPPAAHIFRTG